MSKTKWYAKPIYLLVALALVLSLGIVALPMAGVVGANGVSEVWVDDDYTSATPTWGTTHFDKIQDGIDAVASDGTVYVAAGTYDPFTVDGKTDLTIQSSSTVTVEGAQSVTTNYTDRDCVVFVKDSTNVVLDGLDIQGDGLGNTNPKNYGVIYENSSGEIKDCTVAPNTIGDMVSIAIGMWDGSDVTVDSCIIENYGRIGVFIYNGCTASILNSSIEGQVYSGEGEVCYGVEVEGAWMSADPATASHVIIDGVEIYNCDNTYSPEPEWGSSAVLINGWLEYFDAADSTVEIINCNIHDNYGGIYAIKSPSSYAHCNNIYDNREFGVESAAAYDDTTAIFDATMNWWGDVSGPTHASNPGSTGDAVSDNVLYGPWSLTPDPCEPKSKGFWKNHQDSLEAVLELGPVLLGTYNVTGAETAQPVFDNERAKCAEDMLAPQLLAAKLNVLHLTHLGIGTVCIDETIGLADPELAGYDATGCNLEIKGKDKQAMLALADVLDSFNNGEMCGCLCDWD